MIDLAVLAVTGAATPFIPAAAKVFTSFLFNIELYKMPLMV